MKTDCLREHLIKAMNEQLPPGTNLAKFLSSLLYMGKEAVYRRLRGDVAFSFEEAAVISEKMDVSLDGIVRSCSYRKNFIEPTASENVSAVDKYKAILENKVASLRKISASPRSEVGISSNSLPLSLIYRYPNLARFNFYKWLYQYGFGGMGSSYGEVTVPDRFNAVHNDYMDNVAEIDYVYYIWGDQLFLSFIKDLEYFIEMRLMAPEDGRSVCHDLMTLVEDMEQLAAKGGHKEGKRVEIYVSSTNVDSTYMYVDTPSIHLSLIKIFSMDTVISKEAHVCEGFKAWIQSQRRVSMLISGSGEPQRAQFFRRQRDILNTLIS